MADGNERKDSKPKTESVMTGALKMSLGSGMDKLHDKKKQAEEDERRRRVEYVRSDPLGLRLYDWKESQKKENVEKDTLSFITKKVLYSHKRKAENNIFKEFGKEHQTGGMHAVEVGGVLLQRADFKRHWRSDPDLRRWQQSLVDNSRNDKLLDDVRARWHPNIKADRAELGQKHNALFRQRQSSDDAGLHKSTVTKVKELQKEIGPSKQKKFTGMPEHRASQVFLALGEKDVQKTAVGQIMHFLTFLQFHCPKFEDTFALIDNNGNGSVSFSEFSEVLKRLQFPGDIKFVWGRIDYDHGGNITLGEWRKLEPYVLQLRVQNNLRRMPTEKLDEDDDVVLKAVDNSNKKEETIQETSTPSDSDQDDPPPEPVYMKRRQSSNKSTEKETLQAIGTTERVQESPPGSREKTPASRDGRILPPKTRTLTIFVYRNADRNHAGEAVFISKPPQNLQDLLFVISRASRTCRPLIEPVAKLLDTSLLPIRGLEQVQNGETYLLKGQESLDPPPHFLARQEKPHGGSIRHLHDVQLASSTEVGALRGWEPHPRRVHRISDHMTRSFSSGPRLLEPIRLTSREPTARAIRSGRFMTASLGPCDTV
mmetsp:Transcript_74952/g.136971  ORF Transcript_74952/g.136971 Transcript_74952/m.136971 type:complete len:597 (-) Transcript_74952:53-1843(-)